MSSVWYKDLDKQQTKALNESAARGRTVLRKLLSVLEEDVDAAVRAMTSKARYDKDWAYMQAELVASIRVNRKIADRIKNLLDATKKL